MSNSKSCFKAYDIRGKFPDPLSPVLAWAIGRAMPRVFNAQKIVVGHDARLSGKKLEACLALGMRAGGVTPVLMGLCGTEELYHATATYGFHLGVMITASHNPADENGFKLVRRGAAPVNYESGIGELAEVALAFAEDAPDLGILELAEENAAAQEEYRANYLDWLLGYVRLDKRAPLRILADAGNGSAGPVLEALASRLSLDLKPLNFTPDGSFPNGPPNPLLPERRMQASRAVLDSGADFGVAFDGDFDRCFFYDEEGQFLEGAYLVGLLATELLRGRPGSRIVHDPRVYWNTRELVLQAGGQPVMSRSGHSFMKQKMREVNALYGGEMSAHHYFRDFHFSDSGLLAMLLVCALLQNSKRTLGELLASRKAAWPCSGELDFTVENAPALLDSIWSKYSPRAMVADRMDGINLEFANWRFNLRPSNTEPLLRLNVESRADVALLEDKTAELSGLLEAG